MVKKQHIFQQLEMGIVFVNEFNIFENERKNEGWMNNLDCSERLKNYSSLKTNEKKILSFERSWKNDRCITEWTNFPKDFFFKKRTIVFSLNKFIKNEFFIDRTIFFTNVWQSNSVIYCKNDFLNERFYWTNNFAKRSLSEKTNEKDGK